MGRSIVIEVQPGVSDDLLSAARLMHFPEVKTFLEYITSKKAEGRDRIYLSHHSLPIAVALAVAGFVTLEHDGDGAPLCSLTDDGRKLLASY